MRLIVAGVLMGGLLQIFFKIFRVLFPGSR
jgi:hypothetical protein